MSDVTRPYDPTVLFAALEADGLLDESRGDAPIDESAIRGALEWGRFSPEHVARFMAELRANHDWSRRILWADRRVPGADVVEHDRLVLARWRRACPEVFERAEAEGYSRIDSATVRGVVFTRPADGANLLVVRHDDGQIVVREGWYSTPDPAAARAQDGERGEERMGILLSFLGTDNRRFAEFVCAGMTGGDVEMSAGSGKVTVVIDHAAHRSYIIIHGQTTAYAVERALMPAERYRLASGEEDVGVLLAEFGFQPTILPVSADSVPGPANGALPAAGSPDNVVVLSAARTTAADGSGSEPPVAGLEPQLSSSPAAAVRDNENVIVRVAQGLADSPQVEERARRVMRSLQEDPARATVLHWRIFARLLELEAVRDRLRAKLADGSYEALVQLARAMARRSNSYRGEPILIRVSGGSGTPPAGEMIVNPLALAVNANVNPVTDGNLALEADVTPATSEGLGRGPISVSVSASSGSPLQTFARGGDDNTRASTLRTRLAQVAAQRGLSETAAAILRFSDAQLRTLLKHTGSWREVALRRGFTDIAASVELSSVTDRALALLAVAGRSGVDLQRIIHRDDKQPSAGKGLMVPAFGPTTTSIPSPSLFLVR